MSASVEPGHPEPPDGEAIIAQLKEAGVGVIVSVPDIVTSDGLFMANQQRPGFSIDPRM